MANAFLLQPRCSRYRSQRYVSAENSRGWSKRIGFESYTTVFLPPSTKHARIGIALGGDSAPKTVLFLGGLIESKGFFDLLRSFPHVLEQTTDVRFVFVGDTSFPRRSGQWNGRKNTLSIRMSSSWDPRSGDEKIRIFQESDVFAFPTWYPLEGQPVAMIEAMAAGLPVLTTRHATIPEILGEDGALYVNKQDPADIAAKLLQLLDNESLRKTWDDTNQNRFLQCHTADKFAESVVRVLRRLSASNRPQSTAWKDYERTWLGYFPTDSGTTRGSTWPERFICCVPRFLR